MRHKDNAATAIMIGQLQEIEYLRNRTQVEALQDRISDLEELLGHVVDGGIQRVSTELHQRIIEALEPPR